MRTLLAPFTEKNGSDRKPSGKTGKTVPDRKSGNIGIVFRALSGEFDSDSTGRFIKTDSHRKSSENDVCRGGNPSVIFCSSVPLRCHSYAADRKTADRNSGNRCISGNRSCDLLGAAVYAYDFLENLCGRCNI